jgi:mannose-6-phosphate isomerase-like protein (cupin superfamily)
MAVLLEGGCRVSKLREGAPFVSGNLRVWRHAGRDTGAKKISLRILEFDPGLSAGYSTRESDDVLYVLEGSGTLYLDGRGYSVDTGTGIYAAPGSVLTVDNPGPDPLVIASSQCPEPVVEIAESAPLIEAVSQNPASPCPIVRLDERDTVPTRDRWYRVMVSEDAGCSRVTQFVGAIPPGRAPEHSHEYEEVLVVLQGEGRMWAGSSQAAIETGSCIFLPRDQVHCVENIGNGELRLLGVFYPAGSPGPRNRTDGG